MINKNLKLLGDLGTDIPYNALEQMNQALSIPPAVAGRLLPDAHHGYSVPIGSVVLLDNAVSPAYIGYDISCMMMLSTLIFTIEEFPSCVEEITRILKSVTSFGIGSELEKPKYHKVMDDPLWEDLPHLKKLKNLAHRQLGSSGAGNHFADVVIGKVIENGNEFIALMTHSGSRGVGHKMAGYYMKKADEEVNGQGIQKGYGWLDLDTDLGKEYWAVMTLMGDYAYACHDLIHWGFLNHYGGIKLQKFHNKHNFAWKEQGGILHRKGATPAHKDEFGIIPGSSGTPSYLVKGVGNDDWFNSSSHGAGRPFSRSQAKKNHDADAYNEHMTDIVTIGVNTDETYQAYKDIDRVIDLQAPDLIIPVAKMQPKIVLMGGKGRGKKFD